MSKNCNNCLLIEDEADKKDNYEIKNENETNNIKKVDYSQIKFRGLLCRYFISNK